MATAIAHQRNILEIQKTTRGSKLDLELLIFVKIILILSRDLVPLNEKQKMTSSTQNTPSKSTGTDYRVFADKFSRGKD